jgi:hypothetical protein
MDRWIKGVVSASVSVSRSARLNGAIGLNLAVIVLVVVVLRRRLFLGFSSGRYKRASRRACPVSRDKSRRRERRRRRLGGNNKVRREILGDTEQGYDRWSCFRWIILIVKNLISCAPRSSVKSAQSVVYFSSPCSTTSSAF